MSFLSRGTQVEVKNKKGNSPLWLAANGGHLNVVDLLYHAGADIDSQDNRKVHMTIYLRDLFLSDLKQNTYIKYIL